VQPKHWSGVFPEITESWSVTERVVNRPPPWSVMPGLPVSELCVTVVLSSVSWTGPERSVLFHMPPPCAVPDGPIAVPSLPLTTTLSSFIGLSLRIPTPVTVADPVEVRAIAVLPLMTLSLTVRSRASLLNAARPAPAFPATPFGLTTVTVLPVMCVLLIIPPPSASTALPSDPESALVARSSVSRFPEIVLSLMVSGLSPTFIAASIASASPSGSLAEAELSVIAVLSTVVGTSFPTWMPPEFALSRMSCPPAKLGRLVVRLALLPVTVLLLTVSAALPSKSRPT